MQFEQRLQAARRMEAGSMKHGSDWYKREPASYLGGVQGLTTREHAVYSITLDLIYAHGGSVNNDPAWIAGWIKDMGSSAVRKTIASLVDRGKLIVSGEKLTEKRARTEAKTKENVRENARENGKKGGEKSSKNRSRHNENSGLDEADASTGSQADKTGLDNTSSKEAEDYQRYLEAHPNTADTEIGKEAFSALLAEGVAPEALIGAARAYAEKVRGWSGEAKVQQSDNFLSADRGKWREFLPAPVKPRPTEAEKMHALASLINSTGCCPPSAATPSMARALIEAGLVTPERMKERGIAA